MVNNTTQPLILIPILGIPEIFPGDDIASIIGIKLQEQNESVQDGDIVVITQKIVSKAENRFVNIENLKPSKKARRIARVSKKKPELIELILSESKNVLRYNDRAIIVEHKLGFVCANAGIDHSNVGRNEAEGEEWYLLLPENPDRSADQIRESLHELFGVNLGVLIIDSHGRAWRYGTVGAAIGISGLPALVDLRGKPDRYGVELKITRVGAADELAGAASLVMGQSNENVPAVIARGFPYPLRDASLQEVLRTADKDMFR